ncbi:MAG: ABC transporter permease subunit [Shewanella sp.]|uniref:ABC transporter permease subunit n=1 Tax=Shewanella sp. SNU WT4 TaxID=2590015 RepID=UPI00112A431C|nr:ABC transporter permease subunit [Shewanella sp. SNU WT4]QDF66676.1 ABC transporter permease subunit [Shewanella sp. SNU WT4]
MPPISIYQEERIPSPRKRVWRSFCSNPFSVVGLWAVGLLLVIAIFGPLMAPYAPQLQNTQSILLPPSWDPAGTVEHFLGTDALGRDIFSRILYGAQLTLGLSLLVVFTALVVGFIIGSLSGMMSGLKSSILSHLLDALLSIPSLLMAILLVAVAGPGIQNVFWAVGLSLTPQFVRAIHQAVHEESQKEYVTAARLDGANTLQVYWYVILPNIWDALIVQTTLAISAAILDIAALGFLGLGAQSPSPEWGAMVAQGIDSLLVAPWNVTIPGLALLFTVLSINLVGDGLRTAMSRGNQ